MTTKQTEPGTPRGTLIEKASGYLGWQRVDVRHCPDCRTDFTSQQGHWSPDGWKRAFTINGVENDGLCPWCREDSRPGAHGRGL